jgi:hypothetical protein
VKVIELRRTVVTSYLATDDEGSMTLIRECEVDTSEGETRCRPATPEDLALYESATGRRFRE